MSFAYLPLYTGDYRRDTQHLTPLKHGIYLLLLMHCWDTKGPAPLDEQECAGIANCRSADEIEALRYVVSRFFTAMADGHYNARIQKEIERSEAISRARSEAGRKGYQAIAKQMPGKSRASASIPIPIPIPSPPPSKPKTKPSPSLPLPKHLPVSVDLWLHFREVRKKLKAAQTEYAELLLVRQLLRMQSNGQNPTTVVEQSIERSWKGLFPIQRDEGKKTQQQRRAEVLDAIFPSGPGPIDGTAERLD